MRFFAVIIAAISVIVISAPAFAQPIGNPLSGYRSLPSLSRRDVLEAREPNVILDWLGKYVHLHRRQRVISDEVRFYPKGWYESQMKQFGIHKRKIPSLLDTYRAPYLKYTIARSDNGDIRSEVMPQGYTPPKDQPYRSPPLINPNSAPRPVTQASSAVSSASAGPTSGASGNTAARPRPYGGIRPLHRPDGPQYGAYAAGVRPFRNGGSDSYHDAGVRPLPTASVSASPTQTVKTA